MADLSLSSIESLSGLRLETERLFLRRWRAGDLEPFAAMNADTLTMEHFPGVLSRLESDSLANRADASFETHGYGLFAVEVREGAPFIGFVGLNPMEPTSGFPFEARAEIGWRITSGQWGHGYAPEAARAVLAFGFETVGLEDVVSFTSSVNLRSRRVMEKIGMHRDPDEDFDHPRVAEGHELRRHVLYRLAAEEWRASVHQP